MAWWRWGLMLAAWCMAAGCASLPPASQGPQVGQVFAPPGGQPLDEAALKAWLAQTQVLLVGEVHNHPGHHAVQLRLLKAMADLPGPLVVGVEWLEASAQPYCDQLSAGQLSVEEFAQKVDWNGRWGFPLSLYAPILEEVRLRHLPLIALNAPLEVIHQVGRQGLDSLSPSQRAQLAPFLDLDDPAYRRLIEAEFLMHGQGRGPSRDNFFAAQVARDDTMAHHLAQAMQPWPASGKRAVVLAGAGHLAHGLGLPTRLARRLPGATVRTVLALPPQAVAMLLADPAQPTPADLLVVSTPAPPPPPRLGIIIQNQPEGVLVERVLPATPAQRAGLLPGDLLVAVDGHPLAGGKDIHDLVKSAPLAPHQYRVRRAGALLDFTITLEAPAR